MKQDCIDDLKVYLGIAPYTHHTNVGSGYYYNWLIARYGKEMVEECLGELNNGENTT